MTLGKRNLVTLGRPVSKSTYDSADFLSSFSRLFDFDFSRLFSSDLLDTFSDFLSRDRLRRFLSFLQLDWLQKFQYDRVNDCQWFLN